MLGDDLLSSWLVYHLSMSDAMSRVLEGGVYILFDVLAEVSYALRAVPAALRAGRVGGGGDGR